MQRPVWCSIFVVCVALVIVFSFASCSTAQQFVSGGRQTGLSERRIAEGLKEALDVGTRNSVSILNRQDGYFRDNTVKILLPPDVVAVERQLRGLPGGASVVDDLVLRMNRGAEMAASEAVGIFVDTIKGITFQDARGILFGPDNAATEFFKRRTTATLMNRYAPPVRNALEAVHAATAWTRLTTMYNGIPAALRTRTLETDLVKYVTEKALDGLFKKVEIEERKIRTQPAFRVNAVLREVFGELDKK
jgi:hypothetical protein